MLQTEKMQKRFMDLVKRLKAAYDICCGRELIGDDELGIEVEEKAFYDALKLLAI